eukprot:gene5306-6450_t
MERTSEAEIQGVVNVILEQLPYCADNFADDFALWLSQNKTSAKDNFDKITGPNYRDTLAEQVLRTPRGDVKLEELLGPGVLQPGSIFQFFGDDLFEVEDVVFGNRAAAFIKFAARKAQLRVGKADSQDSNLLALCLEGNVLAHPHELVAVFGNAVLRLGEEADGSAIRVLEYIFASEVLCWLGAFVERWDLRGVLTHDAFSLEAWRAVKAEHLVEQFAIYQACGSAAFAKQDVDSHKHSLDEGDRNLRKFSDIFMLFNMMYGF